MRWRPFQRRDRRVRLFRPGVVRRAIRRAVAVGLGLFVAVPLLAVAVGGWAARAVRVERPGAPPTVTDVSRLNPVAVAAVITPTTIEEIVAAVRAHDGPITIGGGRYSMGGQTATEGALQIDMRRFDRILAFDPDQRIITVQAGVRWRQIQERIDPAGLSVKIMQTYADFTVGGSLSVNAHGRYVGLGPLILSVRSLRVVLADASLVEATPTVNPEIFYGVIGGYGGLGVIVEATLDLAENTRVRRTDRTMPISQYLQYFLDSIRTSPSAVFHNADIYPDAYTTVHALTYSTTERAVTVPDRLIPVDRSYGLNRHVLWMISAWPFGKAFRRLVVDPLLYRGEPVAWRNYEASYTVAELEPASRERSTYVLQEYFVPVERFDEFVPLLRAVLRRHDVNVINISIRHARRDPGSLLAWARSEVFAFVLYYKQRTDAAAREAVGVWTRELIDAVLSMGGTYYLPYQPLATEAQFLRAYPRAVEFFALKRRLDPTYRFRNKLWDRYYRPRPGAPTAELDHDVRARLATMPGYRRDGGQTFLTHPEWYIVYNSEEFAAFTADHLPTGFPYLASIGQYWANHIEVRRLTGHRYPFNLGYHVMLVVIGTSYSAELVIKGAYENVVGRLSGWSAGGAPSDEDRYAHAVAADYGRFIHARPFYEYPFGAKLAGLWKENRLFGTHPVRKLERRFILSVEYGIKTVYGALIRAVTRATYGMQDDRIRFVVAGWSEALAARHGRIETLERLGDGLALVATPRFDGFRDALLALAADTAAPEIREVAGNDEIFLTGLTPAGWRYTGSPGHVAYALPLPTDPSRKRIAIRIPVRQLLPLLRELAADRTVSVDHIYDY